jgi:uncharacterized protein
MRGIVLAVVFIMSALELMASGVAVRADSGVVWLAGPKGGGWYMMAQGLAKLINSEQPGLNVRVEPGGGKDNPVAIQDGRGQIAMSIDFLAAAALKGKLPYTAAATKLSTIGVGWSALPFHLLKAKDQRLDFKSAITGKGFRIALPQKDTSDELTFTRVMEFYGTSYQKIIDNGGKVVHGNYNEIVNAIQVGDVDFMFGATTKQAEIIIRAGESPRAIELTSMPDDVVDYLQKNYGYGRGEIETKTYPALQSSDVSTTFMETIFIVSSDDSDDLIYRITKTLIQNHANLAVIDPSLANFDPASAWKNLPVPLHPGAARAYQELGFMK